MAEGATFTVSQDGFKRGLNWLLDGIGADLKRG
jgi:hypothetical protein